MAKNARLNITVMDSTKARLIAYCEQHGEITQGDVVDAALKNFFERQDREYSAPDLVLERINQVLMSNMKVAQSNGLIDDKLNAILEMLEEVTRNE